MNYQATAYKYNQRQEILLPTRRGTTYHSVQNYNNLIAYTGVITDFEFFVTDTSRKPVSIENKTFTAKIVNRTTKSIVVTKTLSPINYDQGSLIMRLRESDVAKLSPALYDVSITYTDTNSATIGLYSDQNARLTYVLEVKQNPADELKASNEVTNFDAGVSSEFPSTGQTYNSDGTNTAAVYVTNFTGKLYVEGSLATQPTARDWFSIDLDPEDTTDHYTFTSTSGVVPFTWDGMFMWIRFRYDVDVSNVGTLDKILYRA